jgi:RNA polymerase sigma-70 factor, ECF subfamily
MELYSPDVRPGRPGESGRGRNNGMAIDLAITLPSAILFSSPVFKVTGQVRKDNPLLEPEVGAKMEEEAVNLRGKRASTQGMAAGTAVKPLTAESAEEIAAQAFARVVESHRSQIFRFLLASTRDMDLAETLTQECFLKAHRNWGRFRGDSSAMTWLMRIAINLQKDHWRNRRIQFWRHTRTNAVDLDEASDWLPSGERSAEQQMLAREQVQQVWQAMQGLSERQRTVFLLRYVEDKELSEIASSTGLSEGTVKAHLSRALGKVRAELGGKR